MVGETYSPDPNPIGLNLSGTITSASSIIVNDYDLFCSSYECVTSVEKYGGVSVAENELYQNSPNPFGLETSIGYNIVNMHEAACITIYDLTGKELFRQAVTEKGKGSITLSGDKLVPGMYLYSLIIDGKETATKRMVITK
eukprot:TRINITY_DN26497_c0_g1_i1.p1 TRINITY_DN26497_c0_g1~~TRINITY_DN26497_c0_g1_i1.p1  ORF type:complete len:149 (+),score=12.29 TRINITY_DN26497_c0_g1_i1:27-449(+)